MKTVIECDVYQNSDGSELTEDQKRWVFSDQKEPTPEGLKCTHVSAVSDNSMSLADIQKMTAI